MDMILTIPILLIWAILPDAGAVLMHSISDYFSKLMFSLPFSRNLETEADNVGLQIAAKVGLNFIYIYHLFLISTLTT